jgi:hypothetical protein
MGKTECKSLTELLLKVIRPRPGMYLGRNHISALPNFILGYSFCNNILQDEEDFYFGSQGFLTWYTDKYKPAQMSFWHDYFLSETDNDESRALELYFMRLEEYHNWYTSSLHAGK